MSRIKLNDIVLYLFLFIVGQAFFYGDNIICVACFLAAICAGYDVKCSGIFLITGSAAGWYMTEDVSLRALYPIVMSVVIGMFLIGNKKFNIGGSTNRRIVSRICVITSYIVSFFMTYGLSVKTAIYPVLIFAVSVILESGISKIRTGAFIKSTREELISLVLVGMIAIGCIPQVGNQYISLKMSFVFFLILWISYSYGVGYAAVSAACFSVMLCDSYTKFFVYVPMFIFSAIAAALVAGMGRLFSAISFCVAMGTFYMVISLQMESIIVLDTRLPGAVACASILLVMLPLNKIRMNRGKKSNYSDDFENINIRKNTGDSLHEMAAEFMRLSAKMQSGCTMIKNPDASDQNEVLENVTVALCSGCSNRQMCWEENYGMTVSAVGNVFDNAMKESGQISEEAQSFLDSCVRGGEFVQRTRNGIENLRQNIRWTNHMLQIRSSMGIQMREIANIINDYADNMLEPVDVGYIKKIKIIKELYREGIITNGISVLKKCDGRYLITVNARTEEKREISVKRMSAVLSRYLDKRIVAGPNEPKIIGSVMMDYNFSERTNFKVLNGVARVAKDAADVNGDCYSFITAPDKSVVMMLADGMGTGEDAYAASSEAVEVLENFVEAGFRGDISVQLINSVMLYNSEGTKSTTIDFCKINRYTGLCSFTKVGAAPSFIKRKKWVETIEAVNYPAGMLDEADCDTIVKKLYDGSHIIMVSDGVLDSLGDDSVKKMEKFISELKCLNAGEMADEILKFALCSDMERMRDDMTVLVAGIWKR